MNLTEYRQCRRSQDRTSTAVIAVVCGLGFAGAVNRAVEHGITSPCSPSPPLASSYSLDSG